MGRRRSQAASQKTAAEQVGAVEPDDDRAPPRETRRSKRVREEAAAQEENDNPLTGSSRKGSRGQPQKKAKQARGSTPVTAEPTRRKRANTSELQPDTIKKPKAKAHQGIGLQPSAPAVLESDTSNASDHQPATRAPSRGRRLTKRQGSPTASTDIAEALDGLQVADVEEIPNEDEDSEEGTGSESESSKSTSEEEGSEKFSESGGSGAEQGHAGHGATKGGKGKSRSSAGEQLSLAIPAFEKSKSKGKGVAAGDSNGFSSVSRRKGARVVTPNERPVALISDSDSDDPNKTKWPALPKRVKPRPITSLAASPTSTIAPQEQPGPRHVRRW
ncbi:hypothetical protein BV25DRAFT_1842812 [Artomyces pyxidatus]|uniref:Uncharacterized protein n=1 Tax=Artomyces pyxidatus TaxID=48021 RepID=A0ACB8SGT4_9AGAM|nr:hypothetical protein BV25DRAFT_1842812 [Artomyces pyxidatus]